MKRDVKLEICCGDLASVFNAKAGGARRIELCSGLSDGGLTPSPATIRAAVRSDIPEINVLIRPRSGDFLYAGEEADLMLDDIAEAVSCGATGIVIGALTPDGDIDTELCAEMIETGRRRTSRHLHVTFHRAFDLSRHAVGALEDIIALGCDCLLTSGQSPIAEQGIHTLRILTDRAQHRIEIMAGGGVNLSNAAELIRSARVDAIHSTARHSVESRMSFRRDGIPMGAAGSDEYILRQTSPEIVRQLLEITKL